jgi:hypothetical protein
MSTTLQEYLDLIETRLYIKGMLKLQEGKIVPNKEVLTKKYIKETHTDDLFDFHFGRLYFKNRFMHFVSEITDRQVFAGHYSLELRNK